MQILRFPYASFEVSLPEIVQVPESATVETPTPANEEFVDLPAPRVFTQEEVTAKEEAAKAEGYQEGLAKGLEQVKTEQTERDDRMAELLQQINIAIANVQSIYTETTQEFGQAIAQLSGALALKIAGKALKEKPEEAVLQMLESLIPNLIEQPELTIEVHPELADRLQEKIISLSSAQGFVGQLKVVAAADVAPGDCKVEWGQGRAVLNQAVLQQKVKDLLGV